jgi:hypothetical protein
MPFAARSGIEGFNVLRASVTASRRKGDEIHSPALVELEGVDLVVRRDQPEPSASCLDGSSADGVEQCSADADSLAQAVDRHDLPLVAADGVGGKAGALAVRQRDEARQLDEIEELAASRDAAAPAVAQERVRRFAVRFGEVTHLEHCGPAYA